MNDKWKWYIVNCECYLPFHMVRLSYWRGDESPVLVVDIPLSPLPILKRIPVAIRYVLGMARGRWFYEEVLVDVDGARGMRDFIDQFIKETRRK